MLFTSHLALSGPRFTFPLLVICIQLCSQHEAYRKPLTPRLEQLLRGIKKSQASKRILLICLPITVEIMSHILSVVLTKPPTDHQNVMMWVASCTAFFGFFRVGEMTVTSQESFDQVVHLTVEDVTLDSRANPSIIWLNVKQSKTDPFHKGVKLCLGCTDSAVCPVKALLPYLAVHGSSPGRLFTLSDDTPLTRAGFKSLLSTALKQAGLDDTKFNTHSFCIGAATSAKAVGKADVHIQMLGRWKSSTYQGYIRTPTPVLKQLSKQLASGTGTQPG